MALTPHVFGGLSPERKSKLKYGYRKVKKYGFRAAVGTVTIKDGIELAKDISKDQIQRFAYQRFFTIVGFASCPVITGGLVILSNSTKVIKAAKGLHQIATLPGKYAEGAGNLILDFILFGEECSSVERNSYSWFNDEDENALV